jgi:hypothetical protein
MTKTVGVSDELYFSIIEKQTKLLAKYGKRPDITDIVNDSLTIGLSKINDEKYNPQSNK